MTTTALVSPVSARIRWTWLWGRRADLLWNLLPFWAGLFAALFLYLTAGAGNAPWDFEVLGRRVHVAAVVLYLYHPLVDAPHLWATIARTYADRDEWRSQRALLLGSLIWLVVGPVMILAPYWIGTFVPAARGHESSGWLAFGYVVSIYPLYHVSRQHWGFLSLYRRKNNEGRAEEPIDRWFFNAAIWLPYAAMLTAPWYLDLDGKPLSLLANVSVGSLPLGVVLHRLIRIAFVIACAGYAGFQVTQWRRGVERNGPKLAYVASVISLHWIAFATHPAVATFAIPLVGLGHCLQYHRVVWAYGEARYAHRQGEARRAPAAWFENAPLYAFLGLLFGVVTMQGFGAGAVAKRFASTLDAMFLSHAFTLGAGAGMALGLKVFFAMASGVRLHHCYVDARIWRISKNPALAQNLDVAAPAPATEPIPTVA